MHQILAHIAHYTIPNDQPEKKASLQRIYNAFTQLGDAIAAELTDEKVSPYLLHDIGARIADARAGTVRVFLMTQDIDRRPPSVTTFESKAGEYIPLQAKPIPVPVVIILPSISAESMRFQVNDREVEFRRFDIQEAQRHNSLRAGMVTKLIRVLLITETDALGALARAAGQQD